MNFEEVESDSDLLAEQEADWVESMEPESPVQETQKKLKTPMSRSKQTPISDRPASVKSRPISVKPQRTPIGSKDVSNR